MVGEKQPLKASWTLRALLSQPLACLQKLGLYDEMDQLWLYMSSNTSTREVKERESWVQGQPRLHSKILSPNTEEQGMSSTLGSIMTTAVVADNCLNSSSRAAGSPTQTYMRAHEIKISKSFKRKGGFRMLAGVKLQSAMTSLTSL